MRDGDEHVRPSTKTGVASPSSGDEDTCPYQGLAPFEADSTEFFFGRARATRDLLGRLGPRLEEYGSILLVSGASGVGKSSLLRAGVMPAMAKGMLPVAGSEHWPCRLLTPTSEPLTMLAGVVAEVYGGRAETVRERLREEPHRALPGTSEDRRLLLIVDQFEELFTLVTDEEERQAFVRSLHALADGPYGAGVVIGLRADYWDRCAAYPQFAEAIQDGQVIVEPMTEEDLRLAITAPAAAAGLEIESGLVETILSELRAERSGGDRYEAGTLPLLSQTLLNTWERREKRLLTIRGYEESGRVRDSVRRTADAILGRMPAEDRKTALRIFRRMTLITAGGRVARRRATLAEIHAAASAPTPERRERVEALLSAFATQRLLTLYEDTVEIAHDALLIAWPTLRQWLEPDLTAQATYDRLVEDAAEWAENHRDPAFLYRGARLLAVQDARSRWSRDLDSFPPPGPTVEGFVAMSAQAARRAGRRRGLVMAGLAVLSALALVAAGAAIAAADNADHQRRLAISRQLAAQSEIVGDPETAALLAVAAWRTAPTPEARYRMLDVAARPGRGALSGHNRPITELAFSPDGSLIATGSDDGLVWLWDIASRRRLDPPIVASGPASCSAGFAMAFSPGGKTLATACYRTVQLWDMSTHRQSGAALDTVESVEAMAFSPDGRALATSSYEGTTRVWNVTARRQSGDTIGRPNWLNGARAINAVAFSPDGKRLVTAGADDTARLWDATTHRQVGDAFTGHTDDIRAISVSADGTTLATTSADGTARLWNLATHDQVGGALRDPDGRGAFRGFDGVAFSPDARRLVTAGVTGFTRLWDTADRRPVGPALADERQRVHVVAFSPDGRLLAGAGDDGVVWLWDPVVHRQIGATMPGLSDVVFSPDGRTLAAAGPRVDTGSSDADLAVRLWDVATQRPVGRYLRSTDGPASHVYAMRFSPDERTLTTASADGTVRLWEAATQRQIGAPLYSNRDDWRVDLSPDGRLLAFQHGPSIGFWDVAGHRETGPRITVPGGSISVVAFSPDGDTVAVAGDDHAVRLFDVATRRQIGAALPAATDGVGSDLAVSPDGDTLATTAANGTVRLWDGAGHGQIGAALTGHTDAVYAIAFSPDGATLATGSADETLRLWDLRTHRQIGPPLTGHTRSIEGIAYSPDRTTIATVGSDRTVRLWNVATPIDPVATVCANVGRSFSRAEWERYIPDEKFRRICP